jgi:hypothetical protein
MNDLGTRLRAALHEEAAAVRAPARLADEMVFRGARARRRRRTGAAVAALALAAALVPVLQIVGGTTGSVGPLAPSVTRTPHNSTAPAPVRNPNAWIAGLPGGPPPAVPFVEGMTYHWSPRPSLDAAYPIPDVNTNVFGPVQGGVMVSLTGVAGTFHPQFGIASPTGQFLRLGRGSAYGMAASPDGREVAVADTRAHRIQVYDAGTGTPLSSMSATDARVLSWGPGGVYYETGVLSGNGNIWVWSPGSVAGPRTVAAALNRHGVGLSITISCTRLATPDTLSDCLPLPTSAAGQEVVSSDGRYVGYIAMAPDSDVRVHEQRGAWVGVLDVATGQTTRLTPRLPSGTIDDRGHNLVWGPAGKLLFVVTSRPGHPQSTASMVRCSVTGGCDVALRDVTGPGNDFFPTLALTPPLVS